MKKNKIKPGNSITITTNNILNIPIIVTTSTNQILTMTQVPKTDFQYYYIRKNLIDKLKELVLEYSVDTIILEQNQLFINKIDRYPDSYVLNNVLLGYGIKISIEDAFYENVDYILEIPKWEWRKAILNKKVDYAIDLYKSHILLRNDLDEETINTINTNNYYEALCLSEILLCDSFLNSKYQINKK